MPITVRSRIGRTLLGVLLAFVFLPTTVRATVVTDPLGNIAQPFQMWADQISRKGLPTPLVVTVDLSGCPIYPKPAGCMIAFLDNNVFVGTSRIYLCPWSCESKEKRQTFWHEMGHVYSYGALPEIRVAFQKVMKDTRPWRSPSNSPHEQFAEAYRLCAKNPRRISDNESFGYDYDPSSRQHRRVCKMLQRQLYKPQASLPIDPPLQQPTS